MQNAVLTIVALMLLREAYKYARRVTRGRNSRAWPSAEGVVDVSEPREFYHGDRRDGYVYLPHVEYTFHVRGREYRGDEVAFGHERLYTSWPDRARKTCAEYPRGARVAVYFDPSDPNVSCLERGEGSPLLGYAACTAMTAVAVGLMGVVIF